MTDGNEDARYLPERTYFAGRIEIDRTQAEWFAKYIQDTFVKGSSWDGLGESEKANRLARIEAGLARIGVDVEWPDLDEAVTIEHSVTKTLDQVRAELEP